MNRRHGTYNGRLNVHTDRVIRNIKVYVAFRIYERLLLPVLIGLGGTGVAFLCMSELPDHPSQTGIRFHLHIASKMHPDLRAVVAAENRTVPHQSHLKSTPGSGHGGAHSCDSATDHNEVIVFILLFRNIHKALSCGDVLRQHRRRIL